MMRRFGFITLVVAALGALCYLASPFWAAWTLREAIKTGDTATIRQKVVWEPVRESLRASLLKNQQLLPEATAMGEQLPPSLWQRLKTAFGASMLDRFIEYYVTPEGLPQLFKHRRTWNVRIKGEVDEETLAFTERAKQFYRRIVRAEFQSLTRVEIELMDPKIADRRYVTVMELHGYDWKLASLRIVSAPAAAPAAVRQLTSG